MPAAGGTERRRVCLEDCLCLFMKLERSAVGLGLGGWRQLGSCSILSCSSYVFFFKVGFFQDAAARLANNPLLLQVSSFNTDSYSSTPAQLEAELVFGGALNVGSQQAAAF